MLLFGPMKHGKTEKCVFEKYMFFDKAAFWVGSRFLLKRDAKLALEGGPKLPQI